MLRDPCRGRLAPNFSPRLPLSFKASVSLGRGIVHSIARDLQKRYFDPPDFSSDHGGKRARA
jgi:hypothetical protein